METTQIPANNRVIKCYKIQGHVIKLEQIADIDKLIDNMTDEEFRIDERIPYWAELWPSAYALAEFILKNESDFKQKKIIELGCGLGLVGIAAAIAGGRVLFSDYEEEALSFTKQNYFFNFNEQPNTQILDWRNPQIGKSFEIILAADVLYEKRFLKPVYNTIQKLLVTGGELYLTEPNRTIAKPFFEMMNKGFMLLSKQHIEVSQVKMNQVTLYKYIKC